MFVVGEDINFEPLSYEIVVEVVPSTHEVVSKFFERGKTGRKTKESLGSFHRDMAVPLLDIALNDIALVIVWVLVAAVFYLVLYRAYWSEQRGPHAVVATTPQRPEVKKMQPDTFLVLDVEGTCVPGSDFDWPNEIIVGTLG